MSSSSPSSSSPHPYAAFPVHQTIELAELSDVRRAVDIMTDAYTRQNSQGIFSYRLLLPRGEKLTAKAKKIGLAAQAEFLLALRKKKLRPNIKEVRYVHDENHYGWLLANPQVYEQFEKK